jgi:glycosyltransferase involved in cell wall biosynthesis
MKTTKIFITTSCFNMKETIDRIISSVLLQSGDFEIYYHVQDGGSTDGTIELLKAWDIRVKQKVKNILSRPLTSVWAKLRPIRAKVS